MPARRQKSPSGAAMRALLVLAASRADEGVDWNRRRVVRVFDSTQMSLRGGVAMTDRRGRPYRCALSAADAHRKPQYRDEEQRPADKALRDYARWRDAADVCDVLAASKDEFWSYELCFGRYVTQFRPAKPSVRGGMLEPGRAHALGNYTKPGRRLASPSELRGVFGDDALERVVAFPSGLMHDALVETYEGGEGGRRTTVYVGCALASRPSDEGGRGAEVWKDTHAVQKKRATHGAGDARDARDPARVALVLEPTPRNYRMFVAAPMACAKPDLVAAIAGRASQRLNATCLQKRRHEWTYEVCPQHHVRRFRDDSSVDLGHYDGYDVSDAGVVAQSYDHGAPCLGGVYKTTVAYECSRHEGKREKVALAAVFETSACEFEAVVHIAALCDPPSHDYVGDDTLDHLDCVADFDEDVPEYPGCLGKPGAWVDGGCGIGLQAVLKAAANNKFTKSSVREAMYIKAFEGLDVADIPHLSKEDWDELGLKAEDRAFITQIAKDMHPEFWWVETTEGREWTGDYMGEGELTFMEARHLRNIHDGMEERLSKRGYKPGERAPRDVVEAAFRDMGLDESYLAPALNEYGDFELTAAERDAVRRAFDPKATQRKIRRLAEELLGAPEGWLDTRKSAVRDLVKEEMTRQQQRIPGYKLFTRETGGLYVKGIAAKDRWAKLSEPQQLSYERRAARRLRHLRLGIHLRDLDMMLPDLFVDDKLAAFRGLSEKWKAIDPDALTDAAADELFALAEPLTELRLRVQQLMDEGGAGSGFMEGLLQRTPPRRRLALAQRLERIAAEPQMEKLIEETRAREITLAKAVEPLLTAHKHDGPVAAAPGPDEDVTETDILRDGYGGLVGWAADADATLAAWELEMIEDYAQRFADPSDEEIYDDGDGEYDDEDYEDDYDESNDERLEREAREGLEERLRARGFKGKAPLAVVREAFATFVRDFLTSNPDLDQELEEIFHDIFAGIANEYVREDAAAETFDGFGTEGNLAAQTARIKKELRKGIARRLKAQGIEEPTMKIVEEEYRTHLREFLGTQPFFEGSDMDDVAEEMFKHLKRVGVYDEVVGEFSAGAREARDVAKARLEAVVREALDKMAAELGDEGRGGDSWHERILERMRDGFAELLDEGGDADAVMTALRTAGFDDLVDDELKGALKDLLGESSDVEKDIMAAAERVRQAMDEAAVDGGGLMPSQILEMIRDGLATVDGADAEVINKALRRAGFDDAFAAELTAELTGEKPSDASRDGAGEARGASRDAGGRAAELVRQAMDETMAEFGDMRPEQILKELRDGLAEAIDGADAEVITAAMRSAGIDDDFASAFTAEFVDGELEGALKDLLDEASDDDGEADKPKRTRAAAAAADDDDPELMAAAMREALEEMAGEQDGTSAEMLQLIRENLEEALTGEYAEELREALRKAGVEDALGVFEDFVSENLGDLLDDDDESEEL